MLPFLSEALEEPRRNVTHPPKAKHVHWSCFWWLQADTFKEQEYISPLNVVSSVGENNLYKKEAKSFRSF